MIKTKPKYCAHPVLEVLLLSVCLPACLAALSSGVDPVLRSLYQLLPALFRCKNVGFVYWVAWWWRWRWWVGEVVGWWGWRWWGGWGLTHTQTHTLCGNPGRGGGGTQVPDGYPLPIGCVERKPYMFNYTVVSSFFRRKKGGWSTSN